MVKSWPVEKFDAGQLRCDDINQGARLQSFEQHEVVHVAIDHDGLILRRRWVATTEDALAASFSWPVGQLEARRRPAAAELVCVVRGCVQFGAWSVRGRSA